MLKITIQSADHQTWLELEGRLAGPWVDELKRCWMNHKGEDRIGVRLKAVTYVDAGGRELLTEMHRRGMAIEGTGCMTTSIIEEITREKTLE